MPRDRIAHVLVLGELGQARSYWFTVDSSIGRHGDTSLTDDLLLAAELLDRRVSPGRFEGEAAHTLLRRRGLSASLLFWPNPSHVHTPQDTIEFILPGDLEAAVWLMWAGLLPLAMGDEGDYTSKDQ